MSLEMIKKHFSQWLKPPNLPAILAADQSIAEKFANWILYDILKGRESKYTQHFEPPGYSRFTSLRPPPWGAFLFLTSSLRLRDFAFQETLP